jgi:hypothetical protein
VALQGTEHRFGTFIEKFGTCDKDFQHGFVIVTILIKLIS